MQKQNQQDLTYLQVLGDMSPLTPVITDQSNNNKVQHKHLMGRYLAIQKDKPKRSLSAQHITDVLYKWKFHLEKKFKIENKSETLLKEMDNLGQ